MTRPMPQMIESDYDKNDDFEFNAILENELSEDYI